MIDSPVRLLRSAKRYKANGLPRQYAPVILNRRSNVDKDESLQSILRCLAVNQRLDLIFPVHPQTRQRNDEFGIDVSGLQLLDPVLYVEFLSLRQHATLVITDSGIIRQETTFLRVPCLTMCESPEHPITDVLVGCNANRLAAEVSRILEGMLNKAQHRLYGMGEKNRCYCESYVLLQSTTTTAFRESILRRSSELGHLEVVCERLAPSRRQLTYA
jgi:UDP-N-acetylglucosamine 2-epimerase